MVEEAGQVLEAHILTSLVSSGESQVECSLAYVVLNPVVVRHLICIGDPKQLRPTMATFGE